MDITTPKDFQKKTSGRASRRSPRPCDPCRKRKTKCIPQGQGEPCIHCSLRSSSCTFQQDPPRRSTGHGPTKDKTTNPHDSSGDAAAGELPVTLDLGDMRSSAAAVQPASPLMDTVVASTGSLPRYTAASLTQNTPSSNGNTNKAPEAETLGQSPSHFAELYGLGSDMEPILMRHRPYDPVTREFKLDTHAIRRVLPKNEQREYPLTFHVAADEKALSDDTTQSSSPCDAVEQCVAPNGPRLVDLFWKHVQPSYPILCRDVFMDSYSQSFRHIPASLLGAVYLSALRWWSYDPELSISQPPSSLHLRAMLKQLIPSSYHRPKLPSVQAALLYLQCQPEDPLNPDHTYAWGLTCQTLAIGQCLGLHLDASQWEIPLWERGLRKRLSWALYMQDKWTALAFGRPVHIHDDDWTVEPLTPLDFVEPNVTGGVRDDVGRSITAMGMTQFILMVQLTQILAAVLRNFYTERSSRDQDTVALYQRAVPLFEQLASWHSSLPDSLQMSVIYQRRLCFHGYLHFSYHGVLITLCRRLIRSTALSPKCADDQVLSDIRQMALQAAQNTMTFVNALRPDHLEAFWYFTSPYLFSLLGSFQTLLLVTSLSSQERSFWQETLNSYLWNLRMMSKSSEPMRYAVNRLEGAILRGLEHALAVNLNEPMDEDTSPAMANMSMDVFEFTDFGEWDLAAEGSFDLLSGAIF